MKGSLAFLSLVILMAFTLGCQDQQALENLETLKAQAVVEDQNKAVVVDSLRGIDDQDWVRLRELWAEDISVYSLDKPEPFGREDTIEYIQAFYMAFPDNVHDIHEIIAEGDLVAVMLTNTGTHQEDFFGIPGTGNTISVGALHLVKVLDGVVVEWWLLDDNLGLWQQLGMELRPTADEE